MTTLQGRSPQVYYVEFDGVDISEIGMESFDPGIDEVTGDTTHINSQLETPDGTKLRDTVGPTARIKIDGSATGLAILNKLKHGATGNLIWGTNGNGTGEPKYGIVARCRANQPVEVGSIQMLDVSFANMADDWLFNFDRDGDTF